jgi:hypothetical protein
VGDDDERGRVHGGQKRWQPATRDPRETMFRRQGDIDSDGRRTHGSASWCPWWIRLVAKEDGAATNQPAGGPLHQAWRMGFSSRQVFATGTEVQPDICRVAGGCGFSLWLSGTRKTVGELRPQHTSSASSDGCETREEGLAAWVETAAGASKGLGHSL